VEEGVRRVSELWPTLIQAGVAIALFVAGYFLGLKQGRVQVRYQEGAQGAVEVGKRMAIIRRTLFPGRAGSPRRV
jgi:hypothetical protein